MLASDKASGKLWGRGDYCTISRNHRFKRPSSIYSRTNVSPLSIIRCIYIFINTCRSTSSERRRFLRQGITLIGVNATAFKEVIDAIVSVHSGFSRHLPEDTLLPWTPSVFQQHDSIDVSNRYFVPRHIIDPQTITPFSSNVDPHGVLRKLQGSDLVHTVDNQVEYYERIKNTEGAKRQMDHFSMCKMTTKCSIDTSRSSLLSFMLATLSKFKHLLWLSHWRTRSLKCSLLCELSLFWTAHFHWWVIILSTAI